MIQLGDQAIGTLAPVIAVAFTPEPDLFWKACAKQYAAIRAEVTEEPFRLGVENALAFLDVEEKAALVLGPLLLARPADAALRNAIGQAYAAALDAVPQARFELEQLIVVALNGGEAQALRANLDRIDALMAAANAYKAMHDALHRLQPLSPLMRRAGAEKSRWSDLRNYADIYRDQLREIERAIAALAAAGIVRQFGFYDTIRQSLETLRAALTAQDEVEIRDACSELNFGLEEGLDSVDVLMLSVAQDAGQPLTLALQLFGTLAQAAQGMQLQHAIADYVAFARDISKQLLEAISEHGRWQKLDRNFDLLQRAVIENQPSAPGEIDTIWRMTLRDLEQLCGEAPLPAWAVSFVGLLDATRGDLVPPISPPVSDLARDRVSDLISSARGRFMEVDRSLLDWLSQSAGKRPQLVALLRGEISDGG